MRDHHCWRVSLMLALLGASLSACGSSDSSSSDGTAGTPATSAAKGDATTITWAKSSEVTGLDPQVHGAAYSFDVMWRVYEPLLQVDEDGEVAPLLARSWTHVSPRVYDFELRDDVRFSNGRPMTSADVVTTFERVLDPKVGSWYLARLGTLKSVTARGRHAVRFTLKEPDTTFLPALTGMGAVILPGKELEAGKFDPAKKMLGTGPYVVAQHRQNQSWTFEPNPHYWREGEPKVPELKILIINDANARMAALRSGRADIATFDDPDAASSIAETPNVKVVEQASPNIYVLYLNAVAEKSKLKDERLRQAIWLALNRDQIIELALGGTGEPADTGTVSALPDACSGTTLGGQDGERARELIADAGAEGLEFSISSDSALPLVGKIGQVIQGQLEEVGLRPSLQPRETGAWLDAVLKGDFQGTLTWITAFSDNWYGLSYFSPSTVGWTKPFSIDDPTYNDLLHKGAALENGPERTAVFQQLCDIAAERADVIPLATRPVLVAYREGQLDPVLQEFDAVSNLIKHVAEYSKG